ncbi:MAG TPA: iron-sulfur protein, partial [Methanothrix sp.]|nr:iron-sulfur protein [Methanothrix sp.]
CSVASGGSNYDQVTTYLDALMLNFGAFVTGSVGAAMSEGPGALEEAQKKAYVLGSSLAADISARRDYIEQREMQEETREYFKRLVKMNKESWEHEYEYWNSINWN